jgi:hypothetical protein
MSAQSEEYFLPGQGIDRDVLTAEIVRYLGNDAIVRPGICEVSSSASCLSFPQINYRLEPYDS